MSMRLFVAFISITSAFVAAQASAQSAANAGKQIVCEEMGMHEETGEDVPLAKMTIRLGKDGKAASVQLVRPKTSEMPAINAIFVAANAPINHRVEKNDVESDEVTGETIPDPETGKPQYKWGIEDVEAISVKNSKLSATVLINEHLYAGRPGSVIAITMGDKLLISSGQGTVTCTGAVLFPGAAPAAE